MAESRALAKLFRPEKLSLTSRLSGGARRTEAVAALLFLSPALLSLILLRIAPAVSALSSSLYSQSILVGIEPHFVGLSNYTSLITSQDFLDSLKVTVIFCAIIVPVQTALALAAAVLFNLEIKGGRLLRFFMFIPAAVPVGVSGIVWSVALRPDGPINAVITGLGLPEQPLLTSTQQALPLIMVVASWIGIGFWMVFLIAGLNDIPRECLEAAAIDGAGWWARFVHVVLPLMRRPLAFVIVADTVANFLVFAPVQILTGGGPQRSTDLLMFDIYTNAFAIGDKPTASAEVIILLVFMVAVVTLQFRLLGRRAES